MEVECVGDTSRSGDESGLWLYGVVMFLAQRAKLSIEFSNRRARLQQRCKSFPKVFHTSSAHAAGEPLLRPQQTDPRQRDERQAPSS